jgi:pSer/pThr/pTyr-binding forkhead associated (FHA) protein
LVQIYPREADDEFCAFQLPGVPVVIGRGNDCEIRIERDTISRQHARIFRAPDGWYVEDLDSRNGVFVNDMPVRRSILYNNDFLKVGDVLFKLDLTVDADPVPEDEVADTIG